MKRLVEFPLEDGDSIVVEIDETGPEGSMVPAAGPGEVIAKAEKTFEQSLDKIESIAKALTSKLSDLLILPDEVQIEFGIKMSAQAGVVLAAAGAEANYRITLKWEQPDQSEVWLRSEEEAEDL